VRWTLPWPAEDTRPLVVVSLGTTYMNQEDELARVVTALEPLGLRVLVLTGHELDERAAAAARDVLVRRYVPHAAVLPHAALVVAHGGTGTLLAALAAAVPVLCLPLGRDQPANARRVEELGLGRALPREAPPDAIREAVRDLLDAADVRARVGAFAATVRAYGDGDRAVDALERLG
jgi:MGT family glycosyltransferase